MVCSSLAGESQPEHPDYAHFWKEPRDAIL
jgi:hypothetical protein